ncbi:hypothetical protein PanWU01x14_043820 [Parasponia andersonii]|uniref:RNase H type-1 domain-containing protein n=1 Tax=Parasponia andersonii TaxID=3476 RepID=A0A2P5DP18_PARAD|nr:hypothetical protein PanWU01x14_043820 [Parasponia andersonii]
MANWAWSSLYLGVGADHLDFFKSDHRALTISLASSSQNGVVLTTRRSRFQFEALWLEDEESYKVVDDHWNVVPSSDSISNSRDLNTKFFHSKASAQKKNNVVLRLKNSQGVLVECESQVLEVAEYKEVNSRRQVYKEKRVQRPRVTSWVPPSCGLFKMNVDATISQDAKSNGVDAIIRNSSDKVMAALAKRIDGCFSSKVVEAKALGLSLL